MRSRGAVIANAGGTSSRGGEVHGAKVARWSHFVPVAYGLLFQVRSQLSGHANNGAARAIPIFLGKLKARGLTCRRWALLRSNWTRGTRGTLPIITGARRASRPKIGPNQSSRGGRARNLKWSKCCPERMQGIRFPTHHRVERSEDGGDIEANKILMELCQADLRCLDAGR